MADVPAPRAYRPLTADAVTDLEWWRDVLPLTSSPPPAAATRLGSTPTSYGVKPTSQARGPQASPPSFTGGTGRFYGDPLLPQQGRITGSTLTAYLAALRAARTYSPPTTTRIRT